MKRRGLTIIEVLITLAVLTVGILIIVSSYSMNLRQSTQSRERLLADLVMENLVEEVLSHPYGAPAPKSWNQGERSFEFIVEGRSQESKFVKSVVTNSATGNGSFLGQSQDARLGTDVVTLKVTWTEATGVGNAGEDKSLTVDLGVRREL